MYPVEQLDADRRRRMMQEAMSRGLSVPRQPMDERLPDGRSVQDLLSPGRQRSLLNIGSLNPDAGLSAGPSPAPLMVNPAVAPPIPAFPEPPPTPSPRIGYSTQGLTGVDRLMQRRKALEEADPESKVTDTGEILPPQKTGRLAGAGQGLEVAAAGIDPAHPMFSLGRLIGGGIRGAISPRSAAKESRNVDRQRLDNDLVRGLKLEEMEQEVRGPKMGQMSTRVVQEGEYPGIEAGTEIRVRVDPRTGGVTDVVGPNNKPVISQSVQKAGGAPHYEKDADGYLVTVQGGRAQRVTDESGKPLQVQRSGGEDYVEVEVNGRKLRVKPEQALTYYAGQGKQEEAQRERDAKRQAAEGEYQSLLTEEESAKQAKDAAYKRLDEMRTSNQPKEDIAQVEQAAKSADDYYRSFGEKKRVARAKVDEFNVAPASTGGQSYAGRTMTRANLERYAKDKGLTVEEAQKQVEAQGVKVQ